MTTYRGSGYLFGKSGGAQSKEQEARRNADIQKLRKEYEKKGGGPLAVKLFGNLNSKDFEDVPDLLLAARLEERDFWDLVTIDRPGISIRATRALHPLWINLNDVVGWVNTAPRREVETAISSKAAKLGDYKQNVGDDVRLLIVANGRFNSGKLRPAPDMRFDGMGFRQIYFFDWPGGEVHEIGL